MKKTLFLFLLILSICSPVFAGGAARTYTQEIILVSVVPPAEEASSIQSRYPNDSVSSFIMGLYVEDGVVVDLAHMSAEELDRALGACIDKISDEISRGSFQTGSSAGILIRTDNSQFRITSDGISYTAMNSSGQSEIRRIIKSLSECHEIDTFHYTRQSAKVSK